MYKYNQNVPQAVQAINVTQKPILSNFQAINEWVNVNHVGFSDDTNYGKHNATSLVSQSVTPATTSTEMALFTAPSTGGNPYEIYYEYPSNGTVTQLTGVSSTNTNVLAANPGYCILSQPSSTFQFGYMVKWGTQTVTYTGAFPITFSMPTAGGIPQFYSGILPNISWSVTSLTYNSNINKFGGGMLSSNNTISIGITSTVNPLTFDIFWIAFGLYQ